MELNLTPLPPAPARLTGAGRLSALDGLRGWAALAVVFYHTLLAIDPRTEAEVMRAAVQEQPTAERIGLKLALSLCSGEVAVGLFFIFSGIVLVRALRGMQARSGTVGAAWRFAVRRVLRIWPALAVCLLGQAALFGAAGVLWPGRLPVPSAAELRDNLLLVRFPVNGGTWTLLVEMAAVPLLLICVQLTRWFGRWAVPVLLAASLAAIRWKWMLFRSPELLTGFPFLLAGVAIADGWYAPFCRPRWRGLAGWASLSLLAAGLLFAPSGLLLLRSLALFAALPVLAALVASAGATTGVTPGVVAGATIGMAAGAGRVVAVLRAPLSQWLGLVSYSLYLWNVPAFELMLPAIGPGARVHPLGTGLVLGVASALATLPVAVLSQRWIERPFIRLGRVLAP